MEWVNEVILIAVIGAAWAISNKIGSASKEMFEKIASISKDLSALDSRVSAVEAKLDLLIQGLHIQVTPKEHP